ncbi:MAG: tRNA 2-selenouridine(34) synthase MnmH [Burkholderiales bacterium]|nr:tRNA 2-selenouridine(34) synthase MnmH [Burkholderiales bacterium]
MTHGIATLDDLFAFDAIIDVRSPAEFAEDHVPGAINCPILDDAQRAEVGTLYKQVSPFAARRIGGAYAAINIGRHIAERFVDMPKQWHPLVMCWRGGMRSGSMVTVLRAVGWDACQLQGGYKAFRGKVLADVAELPAKFDWQVLIGATGSGKTRLLAAMALQGAQVLDLEALAAHRGSVLGGFEDAPQPSQKAFDTAIWAQLRGFDSARPVYVEAESKRIGKLHVPDALIAAIRAANCVEIDAPLSERVAFLLRDYAHWLTQHEALARQLDTLRELRGGERVAHWKALSGAGKHAELVEELLTLHYDPLYRTAHTHYRTYAQARHMTADDLSDEGMGQLAAQILAA